MPAVPVLSAAEAARLIPDGATVSISSSSALGCPDAVLAGLGERFATTGSPAGLTVVMPIAAGDMYGVKGVDHLAQAGLLSRVVAGSYPSGPSSLEPPAIWKMIEADEIEAYNLPSGVLFQAHRAGGFGLRPPGVLVLRQGGFAEWMRRRGRLGSQNKVPRVIADPELFADLRGFAAEFSDRRSGPRHP